MDNEIPKTQEEIEFDEMNQALDSLKGIRAGLIDQLTETTKQTKIDFENDAPRKTEMKLSLFKTVDDLIKSQESLYINKSKINLQKKSEASNEGFKQIAVEVLKSINMKEHVKSPVKLSDTDTTILRETFEQMKTDNEHEAIKEDELEMPET